LCVQSTGGSTGEDEDETQTAETRRNTQHNEQLLEREPAEVNTKEHCLGTIFRHVVISFSQEIGGMSVSKMNGENCLFVFKLYVIWFKLFE
jgi:hypothetical protein